MNIVLAPHIDDAIFSCWHALTTGEAQVYTLFAGIPPAGTTTLWDKLCGTPDSRQMVQRRRRENDQTFKALGIKAEYLSFLDNQYRHDNLMPHEIVTAVLELSPDNSSYLAPLAGSKIMRHKDHILVREAALQLITQGRKVAFYPDIPYMYLPPTSTAKSLDRLTDRMSDILGISLKLQIHRLDAEQVNAKANAMRSYGSQWSMTNLTSLGWLKIASERHYEITLIPT